MATKRLYYRRSWLNKPQNQSFAAVIGEVTLEVWRRKGRETDEKNLNASLQISDCSRNICLDFNCFYPRGKQQAANIRYKVHTLRSNVNDFCDAVLAGLDDMEEE